MNQISELIEENQELRRALMSVLLAVGGTVQVDDSIVDSINLKRDYFKVEQDELNASHTISVMQQGAPDA